VGTLALLSQKQLSQEVLQGIIVFFPTTDAFSELVKSGGMIG
jgi:hypothetical protein